MAKHGSRLPARKPREEESLLIRSAESLGRMIGSLQRQLDAAARKANGHTAKAHGARKGAKKNTTTNTSARARKAARHG
jgi:hypothetical protein